MKTITLHAKSTIEVLGPFGAPWVVEGNKGDGLVRFASAAHQRSGGGKLVDLDKLIAVLHAEADNALANGRADHAQGIRETANRLATGGLEV